MRWSFRLGKILGIPIRVHATFLLMLALFFLADREPARESLIPLQDLKSFFHQSALILGPSAARDGVLSFTGFLSLPRRVPAIRRKDPCGPLSRSRELRDPGRPPRSSSSPRSWSNTVSSMS